MKILEKLFILMAGLSLPLFAFTEEPGRMEEGMMGSNMMQSMGGMGIFMMVIMMLLAVLLILAILALIRYLRSK